MKRRKSIAPPAGRKRRAARRAKDSLLADHAVHRGRAPHDPAAAHDRHLYGDDA
jgi:hypothetical protein